MLTEVAGTTITAFVLFGSELLFTGAEQTFMDLAIRIGGRSPGGAAKIANVATAGNFTIPLIRSRPEAA